MIEKTPGSPAGWRREVTAIGMPQSLSIHDASSHLSGSKFDDRQYLLLRALWRNRGEPQVLYHQYGEKWIEREYLDESRRFLASPLMEPAWLAYLASLSKTPDEIYREGFPGLQTFSLVRLHQIQASDPDFISEIGVSKIDFTINRPARPATPMLFNDRSKFEPDTPTPTNNLPLVLEQLTTMNISGNQTETEHQLKAIEDEQIVNTALIEYLNALVIHYPKLKADWTLHRRAFVAWDKNGKKTYEARVDGLLRRRGTKEPLIILEVKPFQRRPKLKEIRMQESAQMAAWINRYPPGEVELNDMRANSTTSRRVIISQDRHEVFITCAKFDADYCDYIRHQGGGGGSSFLEMNEYGPFNVGNEKEMKYLGELVLAIALQAYAMSRTLKDKV